jgi:hypothetical protein
MTGDTLVELSMGSTPGLEGAFYAVALSLPFHDLKRALHVSVGFQRLVTMPWGKSLYLPTPEVLSCQIRKASVEDHYISPAR